MQRVMGDQRVPPLTDRTARQGVLYCPVVSSLIRKTQHRSGAIQPVWLRLYACVCVHRDLA